MAFGKLHGLLDSRALSLPGKNLLNIGMALANVGAMGWFMASDSAAVGIPMLGKCGVGEQETSSFLLFWKIIIYAAIYSYY